MSRRIACQLAVLAILAGPDLGVGGTRAASADFVLHHGKIVTVDRGFRISEAIAIRGNRILAVGSDRDIEALAGPGTRAIDLQGKTVIPGLVDSHLHAMIGAANEFAAPMRDVRSVKDIQTVIAQRVARAAPGQWISASGDWHESQLLEGRLPDRHDIDGVAPNHPVLIPRGGHVVVVNSRALALAGIGRSTPDPDGGIIVRDAATGEPTGVLMESATALVRRLVPVLTHEQRVRGLKLFGAKLSALGVTAIVEPALSTDELSAYTELRSHRQMTTRVSALLWARSLGDVKRLSPTIAAFADDAWLRVAGFKMGIDGGVEGAYLHEPYEIVEGEQNHSDFHGKLMLPPGGEDELRSMLLEAAGNKLQVQVHVVGDAALDRLMPLVGKVSEAASLGELRWVVVHAFLPTDDALKRIKDLGLYITVQDHPVGLGHNMIRYWGRERAARAIPIRRILDEGIPVGGGTDAPVVDYSPFVSMWWMVTRRTLPNERLLGPDQSISREEALRVYTMGSARVKFMEDRIGSLEPGKLADLVVLSEDILSVPVDRIRHITSVFTMVDGKVVHDLIR